MPTTVINLGSSSDSPQPTVFPPAGNGDDSMAATDGEVVRTGPAYGPGENADDTRQAQHQMLNDAPVDVNVNAVVARSQTLTIDVVGKGFASNSDRRDKIADVIMGKMGLKAAE